MSGTITHSWNGTVLTITSDSGTSSADLKGDTGIRGPQGAAGIITDTTGEILLTEYATKAYVAEAIEAIPEPLETKALDFSSWSSGSFTEILEDDTEITHTIVFDSDGGITSIGGIEVWGLY